MDIQPIKSEAGYEAALAEIEQLMDAQVHTEQIGASHRHHQDHHQQPGNHREDDPFSTSVPSRSRARSQKRPCR